MDDLAHGIGHNQSPVTETVADNIVYRLEEANVDLLTRGQQLLDAMKRLPKTCEDEETAKRLTTFGTQLKSCADSLEERRKIEKRPYDEMASAVQGFFKGRIDALTSGVNEVKGVLKRFMDLEAEKLKTAEKERIAFEEKQAEEKRKESQRLLDEAARMQKQGLGQAAEAVLAQAQEAEQASLASSQAALTPSQSQVGATMVRGSAGGGASSGKKWVFEIVDAYKIDLEALRPYFDLAALQKAGNAYMRIAVKTVRDNEEAPQIAGAKIKRESNIAFRG